MFPTVIIKCEAGHGKSGEEKGGPEKSSQEKSSPENGRFGSTLHRPGSSRRYPSEKHIQPESNLGFGSYDASDFRGPRGEDKGLQPCHRRVQTTRRSPGRRRPVQGERTRHCRAVAQGSVR